MPNKTVHSRTVWLLALMSAFLYADQNLLAPNLTQIAQEFGFSETERDVKLGGDISLVFWMLGGVVTLFIGHWTDRIARKPLFLAVVLIGTIPCFLTGFAQNYTHLYWLRAFTGIGIGGALPLVYSLLGDLFPPTHRAKATGIIALSMGLGVALGQLVAGFLGPVYGWRMPFVVVAIPNLLLAFLFAWFVSEPERGAYETSGPDPHVPEKLNFSSLIELFQVPTNRLIFAQSILATIPWGVFFTFLNDFYAQDKGFSVAQATLVVMGAGVASIIGSFVGGLWGNRLYNESAAKLPKLAGWTTLVGVLPVLMLLNYPSQKDFSTPELAWPLLLAAVSGFMVIIASPNIRAMLINVNRPHARGSVFALYNLADDLGRGFGPVIISMMVVWWGRTFAFSVAAGFWLIAGLIMLQMAKTFPIDEQQGGNTPLIK
ncbi:MAG TPA: MFS transporter [Rhodothermales bacterium]|nr:MFS transporter [Rhodothermales bacterium]